jgi:hypothetical protein
MNSKLLFIIFIDMLLLGNICLHSQSSETTKPLELPAFIIEGVEQHNLKSSTKQMPNRPDVLTTPELDSLNSFEKQQPTLLSPDKLPSHFVTKPYNRGYVKGSMGLFYSPEITAGYRFFWNRFDFFADGGFYMSKGDADFSDNNKIFLELKSTYIAEDKWYIFGGSATKTNLFINTQNYNFYGLANSLNTKPTAPKYPTDKNYFDRNLTQAKFQVESDGTFENILFTIGGTANYMNASNDIKAKNYVISNDLYNYYAKGFLTIKNYWKHFLVGGNIDLNFEDIAGNSLNYYQFDGSASYFDDNISVLVRAGFQVANNSADISRGGVLLNGNVEYRLSKLFTIKADFSSGLEKTDVEEIMYINPYLSSRLVVDHRYDIANLKGAIWFHPDEKIALSGGISWRLADRNLNFILDTLSEFKIDYVDGIVFDIYGEALWYITKIDNLMGKINLNMNQLEDDKHLTYTPLFKFSGTYHRQITDKFGAFASVELTGSRDIAVAQNNTLEPYFILNIGADYQINKFNIFIKLNNITNSNYYIWDRYKERGFFGTIGVMWQF